MHDQKGKAHTHTLSIKAEMLHPGEPLNEHLRVRYVYLISISVMLPGGTGLSHQPVADCTFSFAAVGLGTVNDVASLHTRSIRLLDELSRTSA